MRIERAAVEHDPLRSPASQDSTGPTPTIGVIAAPALIIHGAADPRVPPGQSLEFYTALKWKGVPVEYVTYPREGHGVTERARQEDFMKRVLALFGKYLR